MGINRKAGRKPVIKLGLKSSDRIEVIYNNKEVEMSLEDYRKTIGARGYKVFTALLTQSSTNAPTAVVLENTLGEDVTWGYVAEGHYSGTVLNSVFENNKTAFLCMGSAQDTILTGQRSDSNDIRIKTYDESAGALTNSRLNATTIEIRVYE